MLRKLLILFLSVITISVCTVQTPSVGALTEETDVDFFWGYEYEGVVSAPRLDLSTVATELVKKAFGSGYSASVYIEAGLSYNFSFGLHTPYQASMYLSNINPRVTESAAGYVSLTPENIYFDMLASSKIYLKVGAMIFLYSVKIAGGEYVFDEIDFSVPTITINTEDLSPLGIYRVSISELVKNVVGKILPKIELIIGLIVGAVFAVPIDWDLDLVFQSYVDVASGTNQILSVSPTSMTFDRQESLPFTVTPQAGGQESVKWSLSQRMSMGLDFSIKSKMIADIAAGVAISYESPWSSVKVLSTDLSSLPAKTLSNVLSAEISVPFPKLRTTLESIDSTVEDSTLKIFVNDETGTNISGAEVKVSTGNLRSYSASDLGNGYYSVTVPTSEISTIQISATKSGYQGISTKADIGTEYLQEYDSLLTDYNNLKSKTTEATQIIGTTTLNYILALTTIVLIITNVYFATRKPKMKRA